MSGVRLHRGPRSVRRAGALALVALPCLALGGLVALGGARVAPHGGAAVASLGALDDDDDDAPKIVDLPQLTVKGVAELEKPADQVHLRLGVVTEGDDAQQALDANTRAIRSVIAAVEKLGIEADEYETGRFSIRPEYSRRSRTDGADWQPRIIGYRVENDVRVETTKLELAGRILGAANDAGANSVEVEGFTLAEPRTYRAEAIELATSRAVEDARTLARAAGLELVRILRISVDNPTTPTPRTSMRLAAAVEAMDAAPPISAGDVDVKATVSIVYEVRGRAAAD